MNVTIKGKQIDVGDALRSYVNENLGSEVKKYFPNVIDGQVVFSKDAHLFTADIQLHVGRGLVLQSHGEAGDAHPAFDASLQKLTRQLNRYKKKLVDHHKGEKAEGDIITAAEHVIENDDDKDIANDQPMVIAEMQTFIPTLTVSEAVMRLSLGDLPALLFKNSGHGELNMVYRRKDGNCGWVDPAGNSKIKG